MTHRYELPLFFAAALLVVTAPAFAFGGSGADCDGDGENDISCSGSVCVAADEGALPGVGGYCECSSVSNGQLVTDRQTCDMKAPTEASWLGGDAEGLTALWLREADRTAEEPKMTLPTPHDPHV